MITHDAGSSKLLVNIWYLAVVYNAEEEDYFTGGGMGVTNVVHHKTEISDSKPTSKNLSNKVRIVRIEEVDFCTELMGGIPGKNMWFEERRKWVLQHVQDPCISRERECGE